MNIKKIILEEINDFGWADEVSDNPLKYNKPEVNYDNAPRDEEGYPIEMGNGEGEIWVDVDGTTAEEKRIILSKIKEMLGGLTFFGNESCYWDTVKSYMIHCGDEEHDFYSVENNVCCMTNDTYEEFIEVEGYRPYVDGRMFLDL